MCFLLLMMASMVYSLKGHTPESLMNVKSPDVGTLVITDTGEAYKRQLLDKMWYYVVAKHDLAPNMPADRQSHDLHGNYYYITDTDFIEYLKDEEREERQRAKRWDGEHGPKFRSLSLDCPSIRAKAKLFRDEKHGSDS